MNAVAAVFFRGILFILCLLFVAVYATICTVVEIVAWPFDKIEAKAEQFITSIFDRMGP